MIAAALSSVWNYRTAILIGVVVITAAAYWWWSSTTIDTLRARADLAEQQASAAQAEASSLRADIARIRQAQDTANAAMTAARDRAANDARSITPDNAAAAVQEALRALEEASRQ